MALSCEVNVKQQEPILITPAEETPKGVYFLSNLDQNFPFLVRTIYYFKSPKENKPEKDVANVIKNALSKVLVHYYPFAGRIAIDNNNKNKFFVDCTAEGVVFVEAEADCSIDQIRDLTDRDARTLDKLFYEFPASTGILDSPLLIATLTKFRCGGFTLGIIVRHSVVDGIGAMGFMNSWGEIARGFSSLTTPPFLDRTILKARDPPVIAYEHQEFEEIEQLKPLNVKAEENEDEEEVLFKSFCFEVDKLRKLKSRVLEDGVLKSCTTFEALSGLVWRARTAALRMRSDQKTKLLIPVDGRSKFEPSVPNGYMGNAIVSGASVSTAGELVKMPLSHAVGLVQKQVKKITDGYMRSMIDYSEVTGATYSLKEMIFITDWSRLDFQTTDFGWGKPVFVRPGTFPQIVIIFLSHGEGRKGINVLLNLPASAMEIFEQAMQF